jgi:hypothetical protein
MKFYFLTILLAFTNFYIYGQTIDNFSDNNFTVNPAWAGDNAKFQVNTIQQLWLNAPIVTDTAYIQTTNNRIDTTEWQFWCKLDFSPSGSNQLRAYLVSDVANLKSPLINGYYLQIGITGSADSVQLFEQGGGVHTMVCGGIPGRFGQATNEMRIRVRRDLTGNWTIWSDTSGLFNWQLECTGFNNAHTTTNYFGFECIYTSTRSDKFYFDDIYIGSNYVDNTPPALISATVTSLTTLDILFNEPVTSASAQNNLNYTVVGLGNPLTAILDAGNAALVHLVYSSNFASGTNTLQISNIADLFGNTLISVSTNFNIQVVLPYDILITELMPDPSPVVGLPNLEYIELFNNTNNTINLQGWGISDSSGSITTFTSAVNLAPDSFIIVCANASVPSFSSFGQVIGLPSLPSLNNTGDIITIYNNQGQVSHSVFYLDTWYMDNIKKDGGWSLEMIDITNPCGEKSNWKASINTNGGTPGKKNSVAALLPDNIPPKIVNAYITTSTTIHVIFDEKMKSTSINLLANFSINNSIGIPIQALFSSNTLKEIDLTFSNSFVANIIYTLTVENVADCNDNAIATDNQFNFGLPSLANMNDLLINEILFNPKTNCFDFVEIVNNSSKIIDLNQIKIAHNNTLGQLADAVLISSVPYLILPNQYVVITEDVENIKANYTTPIASFFIRNSNVPSFNDDEGTVILLNNGLVIIDSLNYSDKWHFDLLNDKEGVSLERISFNASTQDKNNWHSAASIIGYATPGYLNSQYKNLEESTIALTISPQVITPDNNGTDDYLSIQYKLEEPGYVGTFEIFDAKGRKVVVIASNETLQQEGILKWDGTSDNEQKLMAGIYIFYGSFYNTSSGKKEIFKRDFVIGYPH